MARENMVLQLNWRKRPVEARENEVRFLGVPRLPCGELPSMATAKLGADGAKLIAAPLRGACEYG